MVYVTITIAVCQIAAFYGIMITMRALERNGSYHRLRGGTLLEVGCGNGGLTELLAIQVDRIVALDVSKVSLVVLEQRRLPNVNVVECLIEHFETNELFDWIVMSEVLEHLRRPEYVVKRCLRQLKPGGSLLITTPNGRWDSNEHLHEFSFHTLSDLLAQADVESLSVGYVWDVSNVPRWLVGQARRKL